MRLEPYEIDIVKNKTAQIHYKLPKNISTEAQRVIQETMDDLIAAKTKPNKEQELERIRAVCREGDMTNIKLPAVDLLINDNAGRVYLFNIRKPYKNKWQYHKYKQTLLEWAAVILAENPDTEVHTCIAIPYNPDNPRPYSRWTMVGMLDMKHELKVADEFWDFLGSNNCLADLVVYLESKGIEMRELLDRDLAARKN